MPKHMIELEDLLVQIPMHLGCTAQEYASAQKLLSVSPFLTSVRD